MNARTLLAWAVVTGSLTFLGHPCLAQVPQLINYQGRVASGGVNFNGTGQFKFALVDSTGTNTYWSNDGTSSGGSEPTTAVSLAVTNGLYAVLLGNTALTNMTALPASVFSANGSVYLRVWFNDGTNGSQLLAPDQQIAAVAYAMVAATATTVPNGSIGSNQLASGLSVTGTFNAPILALPASDVRGGFVSIGGTPFLQDYGTNNAFVGAGAGNFTLSGNSDVAVGAGALASLTSGSSNAAFGYKALSSNTVGAYNTASGYQALSSNTGGTENVAYGASALASNTIGSNNCAIGYTALNANTSGNNNTATGLGALINNTIGSYNVAYGDNALSQNTTAFQNVAVGSDALFSQIFSNNGTIWYSNNVAVGFEALFANQPTATTNGIDNTAIGTQALFENTVGAYNTASGYQALYSNTGGAENVAHGASALASNTTGSNNCAIGYTALNANTSGNNNTATGLGALINNTTGSYNAAYGDNALSQNTTAFRNVAVGSDALFSQIFSNNGTIWYSNNVAVGFEALFANQPTATTNGIDNTAIGTQALFENTVGAYNTASGYQALYSNTGGAENVAHGASALVSNTTGSNNCAIGYTALNANTSGNNNTATGLGALINNTTGSYNVAYGDNALSQNTTAFQNVAVGSDALFSQIFSNNGTIWYSNNVAVGFEALFANQPTATTNGIDNTAIGAQALFHNTTGASNIAVGYNAGTNLTTGSNNIDIFDPGVAGEGNTIRIGTQGSQTKAVIAGIRGIQTGQNNAVAVLVDSNGQLGTVSSSRRYKEEIADMGDTSARLLGLRPVTFRYKKPYANGEKPVQFGLIAEEVAEVFPELTVCNDQGEPESVKYQDLAPLLLNEFLKEHRRLQDAATQRIEETKQKNAEIAGLKDENAAMKLRLAELEAREKDRENRLSRLEQLLPTTPAKGQ